MSIDFKLNYRPLGSDKLSDRIINSADPVFAKLLSNDYVQKFLMKGEKNETNLAIARRRHKDALEMVASDSWFVKLSENLKISTDDQGEKEFFGKVAESVKNVANGYDKKFQNLFGKLDPELVQSPETMSAFCYRIYWQVSVTSGTFQENAVDLLGAYLVGYRVAEYVRQHPNYSANEFVEMFCYEDFNLKPVIEQLRQMIDNRVETVSKEEEDGLCDRMQRVFALEKLLHKDEFTGGEWFDV